MTPSFDVKLLLIQVEKMEELGVLVLAPPE